MGIDSYSTYTDEQLLISLRNDDSLAYAAIYSRYYKEVYQYLLIIVKAPEMAEDLTHEVFLKIWDVRSQLKIDRSFKNYLLRTAHNKAIDMTRKIATESNLLDQLLYHYKVSSVSEGFSQEDLKRFDSLVEEALRKRTPQRRKIYEMSKKEKKSYEEIAQELNISRNTVKAHISQTLALLRTFILERVQLSVILLLIKKLL
jgi:RNA polymerase sigma-70 factor (ECF subfamily)